MWRAIELQGGYAAIRLLALLSFLRRAWRGSLAYCRRSCKTSGADFRGRRI